MHNSVNMHVKEFVSIRPSSFHIMKHPAVLKIAIRSQHRRSNTGFVLRKNSKDTFRSSHDICVGFYLLQLSVAAECVRIAPFHVAESRCRHGASASLTLFIAVLTYYVNFTTTRMESAGNLEFPIPVT